MNGDPLPPRLTPYYKDDSLDPIQDIFQQFEQQANSDSYSSSQSFSGGSDSGADGDHSFDPDMMAYLAQVSAGMGGAGGMGIGGQQQAGPFYDASLGLDGLVPSPNNSDASSPSYTYSGSSANSNLGNNAHSSPPFSIASDFLSTAAPVPEVLFTSFPTSFPDTSFQPTPLYSNSSAHQLPPQQHQPQLRQPQHQQQQQQQPNSYANFTPHTSHSLSPPSSASSSNGAFNPGKNGFVHNEAIARMIADAQTQGQTQAAQAAYAASYMASLQSQPQPQQAYAGGNGNAPYHEGGPVFSTSFTPDFDGEERAVGANGGGAKKRKTVATPVVVGGGRGATKHKGQGARKASPLAPNPYAQPMQLGEDLQAFNFEIKPQSIAPRSTVGLISNAGIQSSQDTRKIYRDESMQKLPIQRAGQPARPLTQTVPVLAKATKAADKKTEKAPKKGGGEKRKKGEKGHNAVERRYRNNINNAIATLRDIVPALRHLKPLPSMPASRRRASQFTLSTAAQAPTPAGLIDGIPAAKTLSKGTILGKSIEYIQYLQGHRIDAAEDIEIFKGVVNEMVAGGSALVEAFEQRRALREVDRETARDIARKEQALLDDDDNSEEEDEEEDDKPLNLKTEVVSDQEMRTSRPAPNRQSSQSTLDGLAQLRQHLAGTGGSLPYQGQLGTFAGTEYHPSVSPNTFPPSPISSPDTQLSPRSIAGQQYRHHAQGPPRMLLASFMGLSFAGGLGYDWTYGMASEATETVGARAWAGRLVRRAAAEASGTSPLGVVSRDVFHPALLTGILFFGFASIIASVIFLLYPLLTRSSADANTPEAIAAGLSRNACRQRRRADALASLGRLNESVTSASTYGSECKAALAARKELLKLVGAPTYGLLPALAKEALATALRKVTSITVGSFYAWAEEDRVEAAVAWVRIAEIEATVGADEINYLARCYTFLRLFNLSRSSHWPQSTSSTSPPSVNAILALHLGSLGHTLSAHALWNQVVKTDRKKSDVALEPWVEIAMSTEFEKARSIVAAAKGADDRASPSDTVPLLRISEARCEAALRETWAKIFVAVIQTTCPPYAPLAPIALFSTVVDQPLLEETITHVIASTIEGTTVHTLAKVTRALCAFYSGKSAEARMMAQVLVHEARGKGPVSCLGCAAAFFTLLLDDSTIVEPRDATTEVDVLASTTLGWLTVRRQSLQLVATVDGPKADPHLHATTLSVRRLLGAQVFHDASLVAFCASPEGLLATDDSLDLQTAQDACVDALTAISRQSAGLSSVEDSGVEME